MLYLHLSFKKDFEDLKEIITLKFAGHWGELQKNYLTIADKYNETMSRGQAKLDRAENFPLCFSVIFGRWCLLLFSDRVGAWAGH